MMARLMLGVFLLGALTFACVARAETAPSGTAGYTVVAAGYMADANADPKEDETSLTPSPDPIEPSPTPSPDSIEPSPDLYPEFGETGCDESCGPNCGPGPCNVWTEPDFFHVGQFFAQGWLDQGFTWNPANPDTRFNTPLTFNDRANDYQMDQLYLTMGRHVNTDGSTWDVGGRVDLLYGTDYYFTTATGLETHDNGSQHWNSNNGPQASGHAALYGLAMPQLYAEFYLPWRYGTTVKVGHFDTIMGYESVMSPTNFFYSHSYVMQYGEAKTFTGFLTSYQYAPRFTIHAGMTRGWDSWEDPSDRPAFLGGVSWTSRDARTNVNFTLHTGDEQVWGEERNRTSYSFVLMHQLNSRWNYVFQHDFGVQSHGAVNADSDIVPAYWYGIDQYLFYTMTDTTSLGLRIEWFRDEENSRVRGIPFDYSATGGNYYEATVGLNWQPSPRFTLRPELRWDWSDVTPRGDRGVYNDLLDKNQFTLATDLIFVF